MYYDEVLQFLICTFSSADVPTLANEIRVNGSALQLTLQGFSVNDGCVGSEVGACAAAKFTSQYYPFNDLAMSGKFEILAGHGAIPPSTVANIKMQCGSFNTSNPFTLSIVLYIRDMYTLH